MKAMEFFRYELAQLIGHWGKNCGPMATSAALIIKSIENPIKVIKKCYKNRKMRHFSLSKNSLCVKNNEAQHIYG